MHGRQAGLTTIGEEATASLLLAYFAIFFVAALVWPTWRLWRRHGINALVLPGDDSAHGCVGRWFRGTLVAIPFSLAAVVAGVPVEALGRISWLEIGPIRLAGWILLALSLAWIVTAQARMGASWRIGIDGAARPPLVTNDPFALSRNPIFLGMRSALLGLFLVLPTGATFAVLMLGEALIQLQVRLEEAHLSETLGRDYDSYRGSVRRWL